MVIHFLFGLAGSFLGGVAFGPINLSVVELTLKRDTRCATRFIFAAALAELIQAYIAILFGKLIAKSIEQTPQFSLLVIAFFIILGLIFIYKSGQPKTTVNKTNRRSNFINGFFIAILNPQAIPYWIFVLAYLRSIDAVHLESWNFILFLLGALGGKFIILLMYSYLSAYIKKRIHNIDEYVSKGVGALLIAVGVIQAINYFFF
jgi:threonine/homoserine/homoserine lactone efflux protein